MRLQPAITMDSLRGEPDFGRLDPEERAERRDDRRRRRRGRRRRRRTRSAERHRRRADRLDEGRPERRRRRRRQPPEEERPARRRPLGRRRTSRPHVDRGEAALQPAPQALEPEWDQPEVLDVDWEDVEPEPEPEWMGAARTAQLPARWSPPARMGRNMRLQARQGHRAAVIELKPGLYLVAELPEQVARSEFGVASVLAPLVVKAASKAIQHRQQTPKEQRLLYRVMHRDQAQDGQGQPLRRLFQRPDGQVQDEHGNIIQRIFHPKQAQAQAQQPAQAQPQLPALQPAPGAGQGAHALLPPPEVGWASDLALEPVGVHRG